MENLLCFPTALCNQSNINIQLELSANTNLDIFILLLSLKNINLINKNIPNAKK